MREFIRYFYCRQEAEKRNLCMHMCKIVYSYKVW